MISLVLMAAASFTASYNCEVQQPQALNTGNGSTQLSTITFPQFGKDDWRFVIKVTKAKGLDAEITWPKNPMQIAGRFAGLVTADGSVALSAYSSGPCTFTESMCMSLVNLVDHGNGTADVIILPVALATQDDGHDRKPFVAVAQGTCTRAEDKK